MHFSITVSLFDKGWCYTNRFSHGERQTDAFSDPLPKNHKYRNVFFSVYRFSLGNSPSLSQKVTYTAATWVGQLFEDNVSVSLHFSHAELIIWGKNISLHKNGVVCNNYKTISFGRHPYLCCHEKLRIEKSRILYNDIIIPALHRLYVPYLISEGTRGHEAVMTIDLVPCYTA